MFDFNFIYYDASLTLLQIVICGSWTHIRRVLSQADISVSEKNTVSIFRAKVLKWKQPVSPEGWYLPMSLHGVKTQKNNIVGCQLSAGI
jgi:hypothetical protein